MRVDPEDIKKVNTVCLLAHPMYNHAWNRIKKFLEESCQLPTTQVKSSADATAEQICPNCNGTGDVTPLGGGPFKENICSQCNGTGKLLLT